nr:hypothetical protein [Candidatus Gracilibacteria bacterium]
IYGEYQATPYYTSRYILTPRGDLFGRDIKFKKWTEDRITITNKGDQDRSLYFWEIQCQGDTWQGEENDVIKAHTDKTVVLYCKPSTRYWIMWAPDHLAKDVWLAGEEVLD